MTHEAAGAFEQAGRIWQRRALKKSYVDVRAEYVDVGEGRIAEACHGAAVVHKLAHFVAAVSHHFKPALGDGSYFALVIFHPLMDGGIALEGAVESEQS